MRKASPEGPRPQNFHSRYSKKAEDIYSIIVEKIMDIQLNSLAQKEFGHIAIEDVAPDDGYPIWKKKDPFGRDYFGVGNFCGIEEPINEEADLSWLEWDGNEVYIENDDKEILFKKAVGIIKGWRKQLIEDFPEDGFVVFASFDDGSGLTDECEKIPAFILRFWKRREGQGLDENAEFEEPVIRWCN